MITKLKYIIVPLFLCISPRVSAQLTPEQEVRIDSLKEVISSAKDDITKIKAWEAWDNIIYVANPELDLELNLKIDSLCDINLKKNLDLKEKNNFLKFKRFAVNNIGIIYKERGDYKKAIEYYTQSLKIAEIIGDNLGISDYYNNVGLIYYEQGDYDKAIEYYTQGLKIQEGIGDKYGIANSFNNIGIIYQMQGDTSKAIEYYIRSLEIKEETGDKIGTAMSLNNVGMIYFQQGDYANAIDNHTKSLQIREELGDNLGIASSLNNIGLIHQKQDETMKALEYFTKSLEIREKIGNIPGIAESLISIGNMYKDQGDYVKALDYNSRSLSIAKEIGSTSMIKNSAKGLWEIYKAMGRYKDALSMHELYTEAKDSLESEENQKEVIKQEYKYAYEKQAASDSVAFAKEKEITDIQIDNQNLEIKAKRNQQYALVGGLVLFAFFAFFMYNRFKVTRKQKSIIEEAHHELEVKNHEILDSINYAKRIQSAILPPTKLVKEYLKENFVLYKPKDVVAGDFYWMEHKDGKVLFAAADCTGHGVPGAMVSVVCNNALNRSVREHGLTDPGQILDKTREIVIQEFEKSEEEVKDGMDIALCSLEGNKLQYAGANNPLWMVRNGELIETVANKQPIGKFDNPTPFKTYSFELQKGDSIYIFSDGYVDQFGGEKGKKFKAKAFRELLLSIQDKSMEEQKTIIDEAFETWRGSLEQIDDVCVIGVKL